MKVIVIGATGTIGCAVVEQLGRRHEIVGVGTRSGQYQADIADIAQVRAMFAQAGKVDAVVVAAGALHVGPFDDGGGRFRARRGDRAAARAAHRRRQPDGAGGVDAGVRAFVHRLRADRRQARRAGVCAQRRRRANGAGVPGLIAAIT